MLSKLLLILGLSDPHISMCDYGKHFIGTPYVWGGNNKEQGLDCSGLVLECMRAVGLIGRKDLRSFEIYDYLMDLDAHHMTSEIKKDSILFFGTPEDGIGHVAIALNSTQMLEAGGEGKTATDKGAVRIRPINSRTDLMESIYVKL